jgi:hypothetical protein
MNRQACGWMVSGVLVGLMLGTFLRTNTVPANVVNAKAALLHTQTRLVTAARRTPPNTFRAAIRLANRLTYLRMMQRVWELEIRRPLPVPPVDDAELYQFGEAAAALARTEQEHVEAANLLARICEPPP